MTRAPLALSALALGLWPALAGATDPIEIRESPRSTFLAVRVGNYLPSIDDEFDTSARQGPFAEVFGSSPELLVDVLWEQHLWHDVGTVAAGLGVGYWRIDGNGIASGGGQATDSTSLRVLPLMAQVSYRFDYFRDAWPVVPIVAAGIDYFAWDILDGDGSVSQFAAGQAAEGGTWGWHYTLGAHVLLDYFAPDMAYDFDREAGINSSYLTFEYHAVQVSDFGASDSFRLSDGMFLFGLAFEL